LNELVRAIHGGSVERFHDRYRNNGDCLIVDDLQFLAGKSSSQEEIFHLFNCLHTKGKQMLFTADEFPAEIRDLDDRLVSRLKSGLVVDIKHPSHETLREILLRKAAAAKIPLSEPMAEHIVKNLPANTNIRELKEYSCGWKPFQSDGQTRLTAELANEALRVRFGKKKLFRPT
jgi:chromosomal replication initiator protein